MTDCQADRPNPNRLNGSRQTFAIRAYLGGSFDPVHRGHIQMALAVYNRLKSIIDSHQHTLQVSVLPTARSPFKDRSSDPSHRLAMLKLATANTPIDICTLELWQAPPVYSIDTVRALRQLYPNDRLIFIMGADSAASLDKWKQGLELTGYVHLWVFNRHDEGGNTDISNQQSADLSNLLPTPLKARITDDPNDLLSAIGASPTSDLKDNGNGRIYSDNTDIVAVSSSQVRDALAAINRDTLNTALDPAVYKYILEQRLYCYQ